MRLIQNQARYITPETLAQCFEIGRVLHVDKVLCGNGFSTAFLTTHPPSGKINVIIVPNKQVIISKQQHLETALRIKYVYEESQDKNLNNADVIMFVADSFVLNMKLLLAMKRDIHHILVDEWHSIEIQSSFRFNLVRFLDNLIPFLEHSAVTTVTATPNQYSPIDIQIQNSYQQPVKIHVTANRRESVVRVMQGIKLGLPTLVCTNDAATIYQLKKYDKTLTARYMIGDSLARSLVQRIIVHEDENSNLVVCSSRGFEGMDLLEKDYCVFFFEHRGNNHECFYIANLYQALNRPRNGLKYAEYSRIDLHTKRKPQPSESDVFNFIARSDISPEQKQAKQYEEYHSFVYFKTRDGGVVNVLPNDASIHLLKEKLTYDEGYNRFGRFTKDRLIEWVNLDEQQQTGQRMRTDIEERIKMLELNTPYIDKFDLFGDEFIFQPVRLDTFEEYVKEVERWQMLKNYNGLRGVLTREHDVLNVLRTMQGEVVKELCRARFTKWQAEYRGDVLKKKKTEFLQMAPALAGEFISCLVNDNIVFKPNWVAHRNYNVLTMLSLENIEYMASLVNIDLTVIDIRNCFPRVCYALCGAELPSDFYGPHDEGRSTRKRKMNIALNNIWHDPKGKTPERVARANTEKQLLNYGFHPRVVEWLMNNFFLSKYKGDFFNRMAWHEKRIIGEVKKKLEDIGGFDGLARRHDSLVIFNLRANVSWLNEYEYLGLNGWFSIEKPAEDDFFTVRDEIPF